MAAADPPIGGSNSSGTGEHVQKNIRKLRNLAENELGREDFKRACVTHPCVTDLCVTGLCVTDPVALSSCYWSGRSVFRAVYWVQLCSRRSLSTSTAQPASA
jgi:hypothetical protein